MNGNALKWVQVLESGEFNQAHAVLRDGDKFCCLGVACEVYRRQTGKGGWMHHSWTEDGNTKDAYLPDTVREWLGVRTENGTYIKGDEERTLIDLNDSIRAPKTFTEIAAVIRSEPAGLFT